MIVASFARMRVMKTNEKELAHILRSLANPRRLAALRFIKQKKTVSVGEVASHLKLSFKATSKHLFRLIGTGMIEKEQKSKFVYVSIAHDLPTAGKSILQML